MADDTPIVLLAEHGLYLKPVAKISICVTLPEIRVVGASISNWEVMERLKGLISPETFTVLRVSKTTRQLLYFEGEMSSLKMLRKAVLVLNKKTIKLSGFTELLRIQASEVDLSYPGKKDWESYFRERGISSYDDGLPGERPDTVRLRGLPSKWLSTDDSNSKPSIDVVRRVFEKFGSLRNVEVLDLASARQQLGFSSGGFSAGNFPTFNSFDPEVQLSCEVVAQYSLYSGFVAAMTRLRGMKLMKKTQAGKESSVNLVVDFDRSGYFSDKSVRKRKMDEKKMEDLKRQEEEKRKQDMEMEEQEKEKKILEAQALEEKKQKVKEERIRRKEKRRRERHERKKKEKENRKRLKQEQKEKERREAEEMITLVEQRREQALRIMRQLIDSVTAEKEKERQERERLEREEEARLRREVEEQLRQEELKKEQEEQELNEMRLRDKLVRKVKRLEKRREEIRQEILKKRTKDRRSIKQTHDDHKHKQ
ncbi:A-kinase anchor protein 17A-like [Corticium candelabrum]|uniref:A-kinase anchor protein 17A-like n=1 Tax=Corticium candelabrum TaxID=121492 RepID=UPI002E274136|nr:A-kinase anchor protein 17A-like [Corticium candelabrum]